MSSTDATLPTDWHNQEFENQQKNKLSYDLSLLLRDAAIIRILKPEKLDIVARELIAKSFKTDILDEKPINI
jgi:hypothetical protein